METETICKKLYATDKFGKLLYSSELNENSLVYFIPGEIYKITDYGSLISFKGKYWYVQDEYNEETFLSGDFENFFFTEKEVRKLKLNKIQNNNE